MARPADVLAQLAKAAQLTEQPRVRAACAAAAKAKPALKHTRDMAAMHERLIRFNIDMIKAQRAAAAHQAAAEADSSRTTSAPSCEGRTGRAPRLATNARRKGSRRSTAQARSPDDSDEPPPALAGPSPRFSRPWRPAVDDRLAELVDGLKRAAP